MALEALIFDVDGTLAETEEVHRAAFNDAFAASGLGWCWSADLYGKLLEVTGGKERIAHYIASYDGRPALDAAAIATLHAAKTARYAARMAQGAITLRPGIRRLLEDALAAGLRLAIATTTSPGNVTALLQATLGHAAEGMFAVIAAGDMVAAKKPAPDVYHLALQRLQLSPTACMAFEDTANGLQAARAAGIATVVTISLYGGQEGFDDALSVLDHLGEPDLPCRAVAGFKAAGACVTLDDLRRWDANARDRR